MNFQQPGDMESLLRTCLQTQESARSVEMISLIYRLTDSYDDELLLLQRWLCMNAPTPYLSERSAWHDRDTFDQLEPRPVFNPSRDATDLPCDELLEQTIFITGGDALFFTWIIETIESVRAGGTYANVPFGVIDCGLEEDQKNRLLRMFDNISIVDPGYDFADPHMFEQSWRCGIPEGMTATYKAITSRAYLDRHFPGYGYYFWIDSDAWVQDESVLGDYVNAARDQGIGMSENNMAVHCADTMFYTDQFMTSEMRRLLSAGALATCAGVVCLTPDFMAKWRTEVEALYQAKRIVNNSPSLWYAIHKYVERPRFLPHRYQFAFKREGLPLTTTEQVLYGAKSGEPCGIIHLNGFYGIRERYRYFPTRRLGQPIDIHEHVEQSSRAIQACQRDLETDPRSHDLFANQTQFSFRYRVWPWRDKDRLAERLRELIETTGLDDA